MPNPHNPCCKNQARDLDVLEEALRAYEEDEVRFRLNEAYLMNQIRDRETRIQALVAMCWEMSQREHPEHDAQQLQKFLENIRNVATGA